MKRVGPRLSLKIMICILSIVKQRLHIWSVVYLLFLLAGCGDGVSWGPLNPLHCEARCPDDDGNSIHPSILPGLVTGDHAMTTLAMLTLHHQNNPARIFIFIPITYRHPSGATLH